MPVSTPKFHCGQPGVVADDLDLAQLGEDPAHAVRQMPASGHRGARLHVALAGERKPAGAPAPASLLEACSGSF